MIVYHYSKFENLRKIKNTRVLSPRSLQSLQSEINDVRSLTPATFALLEPKPVEWTNNSLFPTLWQYFEGTRGDLLLEVESDMNKMLVGEAGYIEGYLYRNHHKELKMPTKFRITDPNIAFQRYWDSLIPISIYRNKMMSYSVPEIQIQFPVDIDSVRVCPVQPLLEDQLGNEKIKHVFIHPIPMIYKFKSDLLPWLENYESINPHLEQALDSYERISTGERKE